MASPLNEVPRVSTPLGVQDFPSLFDQALQSQEASPSSTTASRQRAIAIFSLLAAVESGNGASVYNNNLGNMTTAGGDYFLNPPSDTAHRYKSYGMPADSAIDIVSRVKRKWPDAYAAAYQGSIDDFVAGLKVGQPGGYAEADAGTYASAMRSRVGLLGVGPLVDQSFLPTISTTTAQASGAGAGAVILAISVGAWLLSRRRKTA